jgi:hypothetical protein
MQFVELVAKHAVLSPPIFPGYTCGSTQFLGVANCRIAYVISINSLYTRECLLLPTKHLFFCLDLC